MPISGWLCETDFLGGWPSVFYVFGGLGLVWGLAWFPLVRDKPQNHPRISQSELHFITSNIKPEKVVFPKVLKIIKIL